MIRPALSGRFWLWSAWVLPALLITLRSQSPASAASAIATAAALAGVGACLPGRAWMAACYLSVLAIPFTNWWCGFAAIDGIGPGFEAARALLTVSRQEVWSGAAIVLGRPAFLLAIAGHGLLLFFALKATWQSRNAVSRAGGSVNGAQIGMLLSLAYLAFCALSNMQAFYERKAPMFGRATLLSPLGSATAILVDTARAQLRYRELGYQRKLPSASVRVTQPILAVFIIGESARAETYGPNQRGRGPASQALDDRITRGLGMWLPTTCAASDGTHLSVPLFLTATPPEHREEAPRTPTVLGRLKAAGFTTAWISNNEAGADAREAGHDLYAGRWTIDPDQRLSAPSADDWKLDEDMLPAARRFVSVVDGPKAMILHTFGNHISYQDRYPAGFFGPEPSSLSDEALTDLRYSRAAEYGARMIMQVATLLDSTTAPAFLVYTSDHGENLPSDHNGVSIHLGPRTTIEDGTVPAFALWNEAMARSRFPARELAPLAQARMIAHADVARAFLVLAGERAGPVLPTAIPTTWGRVAVGEEYSAVPCAALKP
jgi:glucan phosphoethanolaminetransferase (alkaline phosphatase superfamily)